MANVICHKATGLKVRQGDTVYDPDTREPFTVDHTSYSGRQGARVWVTPTAEPRAGLLPLLASECGCYVTSRDS